MKVKRALAVGGLAAAGAWLLRQRMAGGKWGGHVVDSGAGGGQQERWLVVTVYRPPEEVSEDRLPGPLAELDDEIEVRIRPAPKDLGTELYARPRGPVPSGLSRVQARISGNDPRQSVRKALREAKQILETGEVLSPDKSPTTKDTPGGKLLGMVTGRAREEGLI